MNLVVIERPGRSIIRVSCDCCSFAPDFPVTMADVLEHVVKHDNHQVDVHQSVGSVVVMGEVTHLEPLQLKAPDGES